MRMHLISSLLAVGCLRFAVGEGRPLADEEHQAHWFAWAFAGKSWFVLGSEDSRSGWGLAIQRVKEESRLRFRKSPGQVVLEGYYLHTRGGGKFGRPRDITDALGFLVMGRYESRQHGNFGTFLEGGIGLQVASQETIDLPSQINSTPTVGGGIFFPVGHTRGYAGIRLLHISNGGTKGNNPGQNQLHLMAGVRF